MMHNATVTNDEGVLDVGSMRRWWLLCVCNGKLTSSLTWVVRNGK